MRTTCLAALVLLNVLYFVPEARADEGGLATLQICNRGSVPIDVFTAIHNDPGLPIRRSTVVENWHIAPGACQETYRYSTSWGREGMPADIGFAFVDSRGKWNAGAVARVPNLGRFEAGSLGEDLARVMTGQPTGYDILTLSNRLVCIRRAKTQYHTDDESSSDCTAFRVERDKDPEPYVPLHAALHYHPTLSSCTTTAGRTFCGGGEDYLNVAADPATHEVTVTRGSKEGADKPYPDGTDGLADLKKIVDEAAKRREEAERQRRAEIRPSIADYEDLSIYLLKRVGTDPNVVNVSADRAQLEVIDYCKSVNDLAPFASTATMTNEELQAVLSPAGRDEAKRKVQKCIAEYDPKIVSASRTTALAYCLKANNYTLNAAARPAYNTCMNEHDMLQAMCNQGLRLKWAYSYRDNPGSAGPPPACPSVLVNGMAVQAILRIPGNAAAPQIPASLLTIPTVPKRAAAAPVPPAAIPDGTVVHVILMDAITADVINRYHMVRGSLDQPLQANGKEIITTHTLLVLKARILGPGPEPNTIRFALTLDSFLGADGNSIPLSANEVVQTLGSSGRTNGPRFDSILPRGTRIAFTFRK